ncbi:uncharacterized protein LOC134661291 [Cydia amplana]|uniref:uncharacterized protein LOC134661291 n=1 Tax=Cydia amplana TaxID=1869771 RepID=UPI002FE642E7
MSVYIDNLYFSCVYIAIFLANVRNTTDNTALIINLQKALRNLRYVNIHLKTLTIWNIISMLTIVLYFFITFFTTCDKYTMSSILNLFPLMYFDIHIIYTYRMMWIIKEELKMWLNEMQQYRETCLKSAEYKNMPSGNRKFETFQYIFNAFDIYRKVCKVPVNDFRRLCKNVARLKRARFERVRVCGIPLQFRLVLQTIGVITGYTAVILQFNIG